MVCVDWYTRKSDVLCEVDIHVLYRDSITDHVQMSSIYRETFCWTFSVFKGNYYAFLSSLSIFLIRRYVYTRVHFVLRSKVRCNDDFGLFTVWFGLQFAISYVRSHVQKSKISIMTDSSPSLRIPSVKHDDDNDNDDDDDILMLILSYRLR